MKFVSFDPNITIPLSPPPPVIDLHFLQIPIEILTYSLTAYILLLCLDLCIDRVYKIYSK